MKVSTIMHTDLATVGPNETLIGLLCSMRGKASRLLYVIDAAGRLLGVISSYDLLKVLTPFYLDATLARAMGEDENFAARILDENKGTVAKDIMVSRCVTLFEDAHFVEAEVLFTEKGVNALPVLANDGRLLGEVDRGAMVAELICLFGRICPELR